jgi:hypothetical protein
VSLTDRRVHGLMEAGLQVAWNGLCQRVAQGQRVGWFTVRHPADGA